MPKDLIFTIVISAIPAFIIGFLVRKFLAEAKIKSAEQEAQRIVDEGKIKAETHKKEYLIEAKEEVHKLRSDAEKENRERRNEIQKLEKRLLNKEEQIDKKVINLDKKDENLTNKNKILDEKMEQVEELYSKQLLELERVSGLTTEEAKEHLLNDVKKEVTHEAAVMIKDVESRAKLEAEKKAKDIIALAIQKCSTDHVSETTVSVVSLPNDEMKGRIIGREGRNIRSLETLTGVDLIIDDTPEAVILSCFDPVRREVARTALENLILDGRIHPARIEEMVKKAQKEIDAHILEMGEQAAFDAGVHGIHPEILKLLGRLNYRTSYGQNVLKHSLEVAHLAGIMAAELGANIKVSKRAGLLHDIGKAVDHELEGTHVEIGVDMCRRYKESKAVIHAVEAHHGDTDPNSLEAIIVQAADAISASRPGARRETLETYIKRLEKLEEIANAIEGVERSFAIQAGREVRIIVDSGKINDDQLVHVSREIVKRIEQELEYPGQIKVNVIREVRATDYAK